MEDSHRSFSSRRPATEALPPFHMPPRHSSDIPSMASYPLEHEPRGFSSTITPPDSTSGAADGISPVLSAMASAGSQGAPPHAGVSHHHYTFGSQSHGSWPTPNSNYGPTSPNQTRQPSGPPQFETRQSLFGHNPTGAAYLPQRSSHSPATGAEGLPVPYEQAQLQHFQPHLGPGTGGHHPGSQAPPATATNGGSAHVDAYAQTRPPSGPSYPITAPSTQYPLPSPTLHSPSSTFPPRNAAGMGGSFGQATHGTMAPPTPYQRPPYSYQQATHGMSGGMMGALQPTGSHMPMVPGNVGMPHHPLGTPHYMYAQPATNPPMDRPFKCDQCVQSFSRNHDLKRHKRIHLAVKPFPCNFCSKQFSRKDALKRHRLVKGCEENAKNKERSEAGVPSANSEAGDDNHHGNNDNSPLGS